jgi:hypothetical protein
VMSLILVAANIDSLARVRAFARVTGSTVLLMNELVGTAAVLAIVVTPWALGGLHPTREDLTWAILLSLGTGFLSVSTLVLSVFETSGSEGAA